MSTTISKLFYAPDYLVAEMIKDQAFDDNIKAIPVEESLLSDLAKVTLSTFQFLLNNGLKQKKIKYNGNCFDGESDTFHIHNGQISIKDDDDYDTWLMVDVIEIIYNLDYSELNIAMFDEDGERVDFTMEFDNSEIYKS